MTANTGMTAMQAAIAKAAAEGPNMNEAVAGGGGGMGAFTPPAGTARLRLVSYIEIGDHKDKDMQGVEKVKPFVVLQFELSGAKYPPVSEDGTRTTPYIITISLNRSLSEKAGFFKLFTRMNYDKSATHMAQLLGKEFIGKVIIVEKGEGNDKRTYANLKDTDGFTIRSPFMDVEDDAGEIVQKRVTVAPAITALKCFLWDYADKEMWDAIFIDGRWDDRKDDKGKVIKEGTSKNYWQMRIKSAVNFKGSPAAELCFGDVDVPESEAPDRTEGNKQSAAEAKTKGRKGAAHDPLADDDVPL